MDEFIAARAEHIASATAGPDAACVLCEMTDEAVRELSRAASSLAPGRWAVVALGGWGAGALQPNSDLDILVLSEARADRLKPFVEALLYPLWDAGLKVGHQVRSPKQQLAAMRDDVKTCTAALTARPLAGDVDWATVSASKWARDLAKRPKRILADIRLRDRPGSPYLLEPDLKEGAGGRRDFDELLWTAALSSGMVTRTAESLVAAGHLTASEFADLNAAAATIATARWELNRNGHKDRMTLEGAADLSEADPEVIQAALGVTALVLRRARARLDGEALSEEPLGAHEIFSAFDRGAVAAEDLEIAAQAGLLDEVAPRFSELMRCRRPGLGHELTVGAHCIKAACTIADFEDAGPLGRSLAASDHRTLQVAALLHDVGKRISGPDHGGRGAGEAAEAAALFGLSVSAQADVADLVRLHVVLAESALRDNLDDEDGVLACAARVGRRELIAPLHVLTAADSLATGPSSWTPWMSALVGTLVSRLDSALSDDVDGAGLAMRAKEVRSSVLAIMPPQLAAERAFVESAPMRYLASRAPAQIARNAQLVSEFASKAGTEALIAVSPGPVAGTQRVAVVAPDRPQLLARLSGAMALAGLDILAVEAYPGPQGVALDSFVVTSATNRPLTTESFTSLERLVVAALRDRLELATRLAERRKHYPRRASGPVDVRTSPAGWDTVVEVTAPDRPGLLYDVATAVYHAGLDIRWAKIRTIDGIARDVFHVVGPDGSRVDDPGVLGHVAMHIRESL